ncbi:MAG: putative secreted protein [Solirubrobacterales bacterium]|nr:putative secreted protein [Solirubrobacterales bacterium]
MTNASRSQRLRYAFDTSMARGPSALLGYLGLATAAMIILFAGVTLIFGLTNDGNPATALYRALLHSIDSGYIGNDTGNGYIVVSIFLTFGGIVVFSAFIGVLANSLDERLQELRKGRSFVVESGHTLILGWSDTVFTILSELAIANESEKNPCVVILAERDKVEMEDAIRDKIEDMRGTRVVCRSGSPIDLRDLQIVNPHDARAVIVLSSPLEADPDPSVIKTMLALIRSPDRRPTPYHIIAEIQDSENLEAARLVGGDEAVLIDKGETVARLIVQTSRQSGAAVVYTELLDFDGDEVYFRTDPALENRTFGEALLAYEDCAVIGLRFADGTVKLNAAPDTVITPGTQLVAVAEDDERLIAATPCQVTPDTTVIRRGEPTPPAPQHALVLGYSERTAAVLSELSEYTVAGSTALVVSERAIDPALLRSQVGGQQTLEIDVLRGTTTERPLLESLDVGRFDQVIVMADAGLEMQHADARTLVSLLHLRDIAERTGAEFSVVSEMLDDRNRELAQVTQVDDVIVSDKVISLLLAQISENAHLEAVFAELFAADGSEVYLRRIGDYVEPGTEVTFATLVVAARERGETALGYRIAAQSKSADHSFGVYVNPRKSTSYAVDPEDRLIVLAED